MEEKEMTFWDHLEALRWMLVRVVAVLFIFMVVCFCAMPYLFDHVVLAPTSSDFPLYRWLSRLGSLGPFFPDFSNDNYHVDIININVASQFLTHISTSFWFALVLMFPYLVFEVWRFVQPALFDNERRSVGWAFLFGTCMFFLGCLLGYSVVFPFTFRFLTEYQLSAAITNQISLNSYMGNFLMMGLFGIIIASIVNIFLASSMMDFVISCIGVLIFTGLTAYDTQKLRAFGMNAPVDDATAMRRGALLGALELYLDFINLFLMLLRLFGGNRD